MAAATATSERAQALVDSALAACSDDAEAALEALKQAQGSLRARLDARAATAHAEEMGARVGALAGVQCVAPRGRLDLVVCARGFVLEKGGVAHARCLWAQVAACVQVPPESQSAASAKPTSALVTAICAAAPVPCGKATSRVLALQGDGAKPDARLALDAETAAAWKLPSPTLEGSVPAVLAALVAAASGVAVDRADPSVFAQKGRASVSCHAGVNEGCLYPLREGLLFLKVKRARAAPRATSRARAARVVPASRARARARSDVALSAGARARALRTSSSLDVVLPRCCPPSMYSRASGWARRTSRPSRRGAAATRAASTSISSSRREPARRLTLVAGRALFPPRACLALNIYVSV